MEVSNPSLGTLVKIEAGPVYELWAVDAYDLPYRRLGMSDSVPIGTAWERVPDHVFNEVSLGIYGPVGTFASDIIMSNGWYIQVQFLGKQFRNIPFSKINAPSRRLFSCH